MFHPSRAPSNIPPNAINNIFINLPEGIEDHLINNEGDQWIENMKISNKFIDFQSADNFVDKIIKNLRPESKNRRKPVIYIEIEVVFIGEDIILVEIPLNEEDQVMRAYDKNFNKDVGTHYFRRFMQISLNEEDQAIRAYDPNFSEDVGTHYVSTVIRNEIIRKLAKYTLYGGMAFSKETSLELIGQQLPVEFLGNVLRQGMLDDIIGDLPHKYVKKNYYEFGRSFGGIISALGFEMRDPPNANPTFDFELYYKIFSRIYDLTSKSFSKAPIGPGNSFIDDNFARMVTPGNHKKVLQYFVQSLTENEIIFADNTCINIGDRIERRIEINPMMKGIPYPMKREGLLITPRQGVLLKINTIEKTVVMADINDPNDKSMHCEFEIYDVMKWID